MKYVLSFREGRVGNPLSCPPLYLINSPFAYQGFPDVAAQGDRYLIRYRGKWKLIGGTSASAPVFAGLVALLNDARLKAKKPPLGFLNPLLYSKAVPGFTDILSGSNRGCRTPGFKVSFINFHILGTSQRYFDSAVQVIKGWDPVTGLGTPNFGKLKDIVTGVETASDGSSL